MAAGTTGPVLTASLTLTVALCREGSLISEQGFSQNGGYVSTPTLWWDNRQTSNFLGQNCKDALWLSLGYRSASAGSQLSRWDAGMRRPPESASTSFQEPTSRLAADEGDLEVVKCKKLCEDGLITVAIDALNLLVQRGYHVPNHLFYRALKRCIAQKDLVLGRRIHALTVKSGYAGNAFLATHLIGLYASHGRLQEAMGVFLTVTPPSAHNWASIIFAHARHGKPSEAIRLYRQMCQSGVKADNRIFVAVLKACATAGDLAAGKQVHAHILATAGDPHMFVGTCLADMYAKCGSLEQARMVFDSLTQKNVVTWNVMIAGYAQQQMGQEALRLYSAMQQEGSTLPDCVTFACLLQACASEGSGALHQGKQLHVQIEERNLQDDVVLGGSLVNMYAKCGSLEDARRVFDSLPQKDVVTWTAMMAAYAQQGMGQQALSLYTRMEEEGIIQPDSVTFVCLLQACAAAGEAALEQGKRLHKDIEERGLQDNVVVGGSLVNMYAQCRSFENAQRVFNKLSQRNVVTWTAMITGYVQQGLCREALGLYRRMQQECLDSPNSVTYACLLQACASVGVLALHEGKQLHAQIEERGMQDDVVVAASLVNMYAKCGSLEYARKVFDRLPQRNVVTWNAMIAGYAQQAMRQEAFALYDCMGQEGSAAPDSVTFASLLQACANEGAQAVGQGEQLHSQIEERGLQDDVVIGSSLVNMYAKCGSIEKAERVFSRLSQKSVVTWTSMITGYVQQGMGQEALRLYSNMQRKGITPPNSATYVSLLQACSIAGVGALHQGKQLHARIIEGQGLQDDLVLGSSLINMYVKCGSIEDAQTVFDRLSHKNVVTWTAMIAGYAQQEMGQEALRLYSSMQQEGLAPPDAVAFTCLLQACASVGAAALNQGKQLHAQIKEGALENDVVVGGSLVNMYVKCGSVENAQKVFDRLARKNIVTWNAMIAGYAQRGMAQEALSLYTTMQQTGVSPDSVTYACLLQACAAVTALPLGKQLHAQIGEQGLEANVVVGSSLVNMYAKCGSLEDAQQVFDSLAVRDVTAWGALMAGHARRGDSEAVFELLDRMKLEGIQPDGITFLSLLTVCSHVGLVDKGRECFDAMTTDHGISPSIEHYTCMVDLLGRAGHVHEALAVVKTMPFHPDGAALHALLCACQKWGDVEVGRQAFQMAMRLDEKDDAAAAVVVMSNIYAGAEMRVS